MKDLEYRKVCAGIYKVIFHGIDLGLVIRQRAYWTFVSQRNRTVYFGTTREKAILPIVSYKAYCAYQNKNSKEEKK